MRILILSFFDNFGGTENFIEKLIAEIGVKNIVIVSLTNFDKRFKKNKKYKYVSLNLKSSSSLVGRIYFILKAISEIKNIIKKYKPSTFVSFKNRVNVLSGVALKNSLKINSIACERTVATEEKSFIWKTIRRYYYRHFKIIVTQDKYNTDLIKKNCLEINKIITIPNFVNFNNVVKKKNDVIKKGFKKKKIVLSVGRLIETKQFSILINIFKKISHFNKDWILVILGDGPEKNNLRKIINYNKLNRKVFLLGWVSNTKYWFKKSNIFAFTSRLEGFPNSLQQAVFTKLPSISFNCKTGPKQLIINNKTGFLINDFNEDEFQKKLNLLINDKKLRISFSKNSSKIIKRFDKKKIIYKWKKLFR